MTVLKPEAYAHRQSPWGPVYQLDPSPGSEPLDELRVHAPALASTTSLADRAPVLKHLHHPALARVDQAGLLNGTQVLTQAHLDGHWLGHHHPGWGDLQGGLEGLLDGLALLHGTIGAHGAVGGKSLQLTEDRRIVLLDIGLGTLFEPVPDPFCAMPGEPQTPAHDLYGLGCWLHDAWTGHSAFISSDRHVLQQLHREAAPPKLRGAPMALNTLVQRLMAKRPEHRPSISEAIALIRELPPTDMPRSPRLDGPQLEQLKFPGQRWALDRDATIGRGVANEIWVKDALMGRQHARFVWREGALWIEDLGSANGVYLNDQRTDRSVLKDGDQLRIGSETYRVRLPGAGAPTEKAAKK